jgi:hypothetical protein
MFSGARREWTLVRRHTGSPCSSPLCMGPISGLRCSTYICTPTLRGPTWAPVHDVAIRWREAVNKGLSNNKLSILAVVTGCDRRAQEAPVKRAAAPFTASDWRRSSAPATARQNRQFIVRESLTMPTRILKFPIPFPNQSGALSASLAVLVVLSARCFRVHD